MTKLSLVTAIAVCCVSISAYAQAPCASVPPGTTLQDSSGCFPLTVKPADGGPVQTVVVPATFVFPVETSTHVPKAAIKHRELDFGANSFFVDPDYAGGSNVDVGGFVAYTMNKFGIEVDAADAVRTASGIHEPYIVAGPRFQYTNWHVTVFAKAQAGIGHFSGAPLQPFNNKQNMVLENYGAGLEFRILPHVKIRAVDANYQVWPTFAPHNLTPMRIGSGIVFTL